VFYKQALVPRLLSHAETSTYLAVVLGQSGLGDVQMQTAGNNDVLETNLTYLKTIMGKTV